MSFAISNRHLTFVFVVFEKFTETGFWLFYPRTILPIHSHTRSAEAPLPRGFKSSGNKQQVLNPWDMRLVEVVTILRVDPRMCTTYGR